MDDIDLDPVERPMGDIPGVLPDRPAHPLYRNETLGIGFETFRGMLYALPFAILLWALLGWLIYALL